MALIAYMSVKGKTQGDIKGGSTQGGDKKDKIEVFASDHTVEIPKDTHTGLPTGQRIHHPFKVVKRKDKASPKLFKACCTGEQCTVELDYFEIQATGAESKYYTVKLENAIVVNMREHTPLTFLPDNKPYHDMEDVSFTYSKITWTHSDGNIEFTDDWQAAGK